MLQARGHTQLRNVDTPAELAKVSEISALYCSLSRSRSLSISLSLSLSLYLSLSFFLSFFLAFLLSFLLSFFPSFFLSVSLFLRVVLLLLLFCPSLSLCLALALCFSLLRLSTSLSQPRESAAPATQTLVAEKSARVRAILTLEHPQELKPAEGCAFWRFAFPRRTRTFCSIRELAFD